MLHNKMIHAAQQLACSPAADLLTTRVSAGIVHQAPAFGEDDYRVCLANGIIEKGEGVPCPVDLSGRFAPEVTDFAGAHVKVGGAPSWAEV